MHAKVLPYQLKCVLMENQIWHFYESVKPRNKTTNVTNVYPCVMNLKMDYRNIMYWQIFNDYDNCTRYKWDKRVKRNAWIVVDAVMQRAWTLCRILFRVLLSVSRRWKPVPNDPHKSLVQHCHATANYMGAGDSTTKKSSVCSWTCRQAKPIVEPTACDAINNYNNTICSSFASYFGDV